MLLSILEPKHGFIACICPINTFCELVADVSGRRHVFCWNSSDNAGVFFFNGVRSSGTLSAPEACRKSIFYSTHATRKVGRAISFCASEKEVDGEPYPCLAMADSAGRRLQSSEGNQNSLSSPNKMHLTWSPLSRYCWSVWWRVHFLGESDSKPPVVSSCVRRDARRAADVKKSQGGAIAAKLIP